MVQRMQPLLLSDPHVSAALAEAVPTYGLGVRATAVHSQTCHFNPPPFTVPKRPRSSSLSLAILNYAARAPGHSGAHTPDTRPARVGPLI